MVMFFNILFNSTLPWEYILVALVGFVLAAMIALVFHEFAHAFAAWKSGDGTAKLAGRMSFNPARHLSPLGFASFIFIGIGWAKPVPVNPFNFRNYKKGNFWVSIAGVLTNLVLGLLFSFFYVLVRNLADTTNVFLFGLETFFYFAMNINIVLMIFNLLPVPPLDGYNLLKSFTKPDNRYMQFARDNQNILLPVVLIVSLFTGAIWHLMNGITWCFEMFWGLMIS
jgi:Zn-dependent protease